LVSENGEKGLGDEGADGGNAPQSFWGRTAPAQISFNMKTDMCTNAIMHEINLTNDTHQLVIYKINFSYHHIVHC